MDGWITFWKIACTVGFVAFYLLVAVVIPLGARDLARLLRFLSTKRASQPDAARSRRD